MDIFEIKSRKLNIGNLIIPFVDFSYLENIYKEFEEEKISRDDLYNYYDELACVGVFGNINGEYHDYIYTKNKYLRALLIEGEQENINLIYNYSYYFKNRERFDEILDNFIKKRIRNKTNWKFIQLDDMFPNKKIL